MRQRRSDYWRQKRREKAGNQAFYDAYRRLRETGSTLSDVLKDTVADTGHQAQTDRSQAIVGAPGAQYDQPDTVGGNK